MPPPLLSPSPPLWFPPCLQTVSTLWNYLRVIIISRHMTHVTHCLCGAGGGGGGVGVIVVVMVVGGGAVFGLTERERLKK